MRGYRIMRDEVAEVVAPPDGETYIMGKDLKLKTPKALQEAAAAQAGPETKPPDEVKAVPAAQPRPVETASIADDKKPASRAEGKH